jgi:hypothetical protein
MPFATQAAMLGGNLGVGMEDSLFIVWVPETARTALTCPFVCGRWPGMIR